MLKAFGLAATWSTVRFVNFAISTPQKPEGPAAARAATAQIDFADNFLPPST
jgi:hypothetical protein